VTDPEFHYAERVARIDVDIANIDRHLATCDAKRRAHSLDAGAKRLRSATSNGQGH
jgi:hypothetical protein